MLLDKNKNNFGSDGWCAEFLLLSFSATKHCPSIFTYSLPSKAGETGCGKLIQAENDRYAPGKIL